MTAQTNIALQLIQTLSDEEKKLFASEFNKMYTPTETKSKPKPKNYNLDPSYLAKVLLDNHRKRNQNTTLQVKLA